LQAVKEGVDIIRAMNYWNLKSLHKQDFRNSPGPDPLPCCKAINFHVSATDKSFSLNRCQWSTIHFIHSREDIFFSATSAWLGSDIQKSSE